MKGLGDIFAGAAHQTHGQEQVLLQEVRGHPLNVVREGRGEEQRVAVPLPRHVRVPNQSEPRVLDIRALESRIR